MQTLNYTDPNDNKVAFDKYVIDQEETKKTLSVAVFNHYQKINHPVIDGIELEKSKYAYFL